MRINCINTYISKKPVNYYNCQNVSFRPELYKEQNQYTVSFEAAVPESLKDVFLERKVYENWISKLPASKIALGKKVAFHNLGIELGEKLCRKSINNNVDYTDAIAKLRNKMLERNFEFTLSTNWIVDNKNLNAINYILEHSEKIFTAIKYLGVNSLIYALVMKQQRFEALLNDVDRYVAFAPESHLELLMELTNPSMTQQYKYLSNEKDKIQSKIRGDEEFLEIHSNNKRLISVLQRQIKEKKSEQDIKFVKKLYQKISNIRQEEISIKPENFKALESAMTKIKAQINKTLSKDIKDPQKKIELFYLYKNIINIDDIRELNRMYLDNHAGNSEGVLKTFLLQKLADAYDLTPKEHLILASLNLQESPYFTRLFRAAPEKEIFAYGQEVHNVYLQKGFYDNFKKMLGIIANSSDFSEYTKGEISIEKCLQKVFDRLPQNEKTKQIFDLHNLNYDVWAGYDEKRDQIRLDERTVVRKVNMNDLKHSLFLGNQSCCCTAVGTGSRSASAATYPINNFVQAIELLVDGDVVGNTMCYLANVEAKNYPRLKADAWGEVEVKEKTKQNKLALVLDNIEVVKPYNIYEKNLSAFILYAKKLVSDIGGNSEMAIYAGHRNSFSMDDYANKDSLSMRILGESRERSLSLDSISNLAIINDTISSDKYYYGNFYCIKP